MRPHLLMLALVAVLASASTAVAKDDPRPPGHEKAPPSADCRPRTAVILRGTLVAVGESSFRMIVRRAYGRLRGLRGRREVSVDARTRFRRNGEPAALAALRPNDRLLVYARGCKRRRGGFVLLAQQVFAHGPAAPETP